MKEKIAIVTGASSGLGRHTALALQKAGFKVVAGARSFLNEDAFLPNGITCLPLDVTQKHSIECFIEKTLALYGHIDILANCAGVLVLGAAEKIEIEQFKQVMETNFIGMVAMIQAVLPHFRHRHTGRIINFSSINGLLGIPFQSPYTASKHAIEGYSECLRMEVKPFGIEVMLVEPGDHRGGSDSYRTKVLQAESDPYATCLNRTIKVIAHDESHGLSPDKLGEKIARLLKRKRLPFRVRIAKLDQHLAVLLHAIFPIKLLFFILTQYYTGKKE